MMKSSQQSAIGSQLSAKETISENGLLRSAFNNQREDYYQQSISSSESRLLKADSQSKGFSFSQVLSRCLVVLLSLFLISCGDEGLVDPHGETTLPAPDTSSGLHAIDFPTATGSAWTYVNIDTNQEFALRVEGTRDISGTTHRQMTVSALTTDEPDQFSLDTVDHLAANAYYFRIDTDFYDVFPFPVLATYFTKTSEALIESAFDIYLPIENPVYHAKHFPPRRLWDFPLKVGKQWTVFEKTAGAPVTVTRYVVEQNVQITVPAGTYTTYVVQEEVVYADSEDPSIFIISPPAIYWVAPSVGVVQYRYNRYRATDAFSAQTFALKRVHLPGPNTD